VSGSTSTGATTTVGWLGYDTARLLVLQRRVASAADELAALVSGEQPRSDAASTVQIIVDALWGEWVPVLRRIATDTTLTSWSTAAPTGSWLSDLPQPPSGDARAVAGWWEGLSEIQQQAVIANRPAMIGNRDGVPAWARDLANRRLLSADLERLTASAAADVLNDADAAVLASARAVEEALADGTDVVDPRTGVAVGVQLYLYEPGAYGGDGRAAVALGDLDTARHVAIAVSGMGTEASRIDTTVAGVVLAAATRHTPDTIAVMAWHGYDAPSIVVTDGSDVDPVGDAVDWVDETGDLAHVVTMSYATSGAAVLAADVSGVRAMRTDDAHVTVIGNSYGSTTVAIAADAFDLAADDVILTGSPGAGRADDAGDLTTEAANTWVGSASDDPVSYLGRTGGAEPHDVVDVGFGGAEVGLGNDPAEDDFGARRFQAEWSGRDDDFPWPLAGHGHYFDPCAEAPDNIGAIVAGEYDAVRTAEHRHKDESWDLWDPLGDLLPADPEADEAVDGPGCRSGQGAD
jgi:Alpha/beta hydrolase